MVILTIDIGTSVAKVVAFDAKARVCAQARATYPTHRPCPGWAEQDPVQWWRAIRQATRSVVQQLHGQDIAGIGLTGQMHGLVLLGDHGKPLMPCLIWMDTRAESQVLALNKTLGEQEILHRTGNRPVPAFPATKLLWVREHFPQVHKKIRWILMPKDYIGYLLTRNICTDPSDASGTLLYNLWTKEWDDAMLFAVGVARDVLPPIGSSTSILGKLTKTAARELQIAAGTPVITGGGDLATSALGVGAVTPDKVGLILGTAGQLLFVIERGLEGLLGKFYFFAHVLPNVILGLGTLPTGGAALAWLTKTIGSDGEAEEKRIEELLGLAENVPPGANGLVFLPYLAGTGTPYMDYKSKAALLGLTEAHGREHIVRAVLEGIGYAMRDSLQVLWDWGMCPNEVFVGGGSMRAKMVQQTLADILGLPLQVVSNLDASPIGAFCLAAVGLGVYLDIQEACKIATKIEKTVLPTEAAQYYAEKFKSFRQFSHAWRTGFHFMDL